MKLLTSGKKKHDNIQTVMYKKRILSDSFRFIFNKLANKQKSHICVVLVAIVEKIPSLHIRLSLTLSGFYFA